MATERAAGDSRPHTAPRERGTEDAVATERRAGSFLAGFGLGATVTLLTGIMLLHGLHTIEVATVPVLDGPLMGDAVGWIYQNLGWSIPVFALVLLLYVQGLATLRRRLAQGAMVARVGQAEHLVDTWTGLFFGIGVIFTAIGMRGALLYALGDPDATVREGAVAVLQRMVDGGILLALSTTIFGGIGGYVMRVVKTVTVGAELKRYYGDVAGRQGAEIHSTLERIEVHLRDGAGAAGEGARP